MQWISFRHRRVRQVAAFVLLSGALICLFPFDHPISRFFADHAQWVALGYLAAGLLFFLWNRTRLMFVCMGCCAAICIYNLEIVPKNREKLPQIDQKSSSHPGVSIDTIKYEYSKKN